MGYSLQGTAKTTEGSRHPDRNAQFTHIKAAAAAFLSADQPVISVDTKAKAWIGNRDRPGRTWRPGKDPIKVDCHCHLIADGQPVAVPYGVYDLATNAGWVNIGTDHDTAACAVESIRRWWHRRGRLDHPRAIRLLITADSGGSNNPRYWTWKKRPHAFAHAPASGTLIRNSLPCPTLTVRNPGSCRPGFRSVRHRLSDRWICGPGRPR
ncbi:hypothetical protein OEIGOIKO_01975 [Streptomyces chrestomyceticus JCM 4735]|uniref:Transposase n=1 Tax=Streptomyces chrestomyceticus JCM 4735 TaxID=1306181 RepID=A0A7U9KT01_9ACTN|nr:hypothetical protein OEIGOIKO_01975 [Streptomyces chrestomyceticus JCM 4735]